jgi:hypothetical protein
MQVIRCSRCGGFIRSHELRYLIGLHVTLDRDGFTEQDLGDPCRRVEATRRVGESLDERFTCEKAFVVCSSCRDQIVDNPLGAYPEMMLPDLGFVQ